MEQLNNIQDIVIEKTIETFINKGVEKISSLYNSYREKLKAQAKKDYSISDYEYFLNKFNLEISESQVLEYILYNLKTSTNWSNEVSFTTAITSKELNKIFVDIDLYISPLKRRFYTDEITAKINTEELLSTLDKNKIIYGGAGAGKTTLIKKIYLNFEIIKKNNGFICPIMIRFRELDYDNLKKENTGLFSILAKLLGLRFNFPKQKKYIDKFNDQYDEIVKKTVISFMDDCRILLIADGFDEIPDINIKRKIEKDFYELSISLSNSKFILTSRTNDFTSNLLRTDAYEICPLNDEQIKRIISKWITKKSDADILFKEIQLSPFYDTAMRPLTLSHLCAIYERKKTIPPKPRYVYDFIIGLLLELWDQERSIIRPSEYADFYVEKKKEFLAHLSFWLSYHMNINVFSSDDIRKCYNFIYISHNLPKSQATKIVRELESHTGIFVQTGQTYYQFSHKSLQEFLAAKYICSLPKIPESSVLNKLPNETAIVISLTSSPSFYFAEFDLNFKDYSPDFWKIFFIRLIDEKPDFDNNPGTLVFFFKTNS